MFKRLAAIGVIAAILGCLYPCPAVAGAARIETGNSLVDNTGRKIVVVVPFKRVVSLYGAHTENLFSLGCGKYLVGVSRSETWPPQALALPVFSSRDDPEKFLAAGPDLVLIRPMIDRAHPGLVDRLEKSGIQVVSLQPNTVDEMFVYWEILGMLTGRRDSAREMVQHFRSALASLRGLTNGMQPQKRVYFEAIHSKMKTFTPGAMAIFALEAAGGINVAADARQVRTTTIAFYGKERILAKAGQIDVYLAQKGVMNRTSRDIIAQEPGFHLIKAVRQGRIHIIDENIVSRPTLRLLEGIAAIGTALYPEMYTERAQRILEEAGVSKHSF